MEAAFVFRPYKADDLNFIHSSWGSSYFKGITYRHLLGSDTFHSYHRPIRQRILDREESAVIVCASKSEDLILAWMAIEEPKKTSLTIVHYLYVKEAFKGEKIATALINELPKNKDVLYTHQTERAQKIINRNHDKFKQWVFTPHLL